LGGLSPAGQWFSQLLLQELQPQIRGDCILLKFTGEADVHAVDVVPHVHAQLAINNTLCLQIIVVVEFLIILGLLVFICCIYK
jgi:hypothetical protein